MRPRQRVGKGVQYMIEKTLGRVIVVTNSLQNYNSLTVEKTGYGEVMVAYKRCEVYHTSPSGMIREKENVQERFKQPDEGRKSPQKV